MAFSALEALQAFGAGRQIAQQERQLARAEALQVRQDAGRTRVGELVRAGDFTGAAATAFESELGDDVMQSVQRLSQAQSSQLLRETQAGLAAVDALSGIADDTQRAAAAQQLVPQLRAAGFSDEELAQHLQDLSLPTLQARKVYLERVAAGLGPRQGQQQVPSRAREIAYWRENGRDDLANALEARISTRAVPVPQRDGTVKIYQVPITVSQTGAPSYAEEPEELSDDDVAADLQGGPGQTAPETFPGYSGGLPAEYPPGEW